MRVSCSAAVLANTIAAMRDAGSRGTEHVVLWLAPRPVCGDVRITEMFVPEQEAAADFFVIPPHAMRALMRYLRDQKLALIAQVHSHPENAFHSPADDRWAIARHVGALSVVVPNFARSITIDGFADEAAFFQLDAADVWRRVDGIAVSQVFEVIPDDA